MAYGGPSDGGIRSGWTRSPPSRHSTAQGKPVVRQGRKARDLRTAQAPKAARPPVAIDAATHEEVRTVKANLAHFTSPAIKWLSARYGVVLTLVALASLALTLGAGQKWD
jgi:hypothetical protein